MNNHKIVLTALLASMLFAACSTDEQLPAPTEKGNEVQLSAVLEEVKVVSRAAAKPIEPSVVAPYYLYYETSSNASVPKEFTGNFASSSGVYWDDVKLDASGNATFQLTNVAKGNIYPSESDKDIQWGAATGSNTDPATPLAFTLTHRMAQLSLVLIDKTNSGHGSISDTYKDVKVAISGLSKDARSFDPKTGKLEVTPRETEVTLYEKGADEIGTGVTGGIQYSSATAYYPPQEFKQSADKRDSLRITCGKYTYTVEVPRVVTGSTESVTALCPGEHLTITITLQDEAVDLKATLAPWEDVVAEDMPLNRVFNIASLEELKDFALAVNTGYDFKGMIVRVTSPITFTDSDALYCFNIGTKNHPFRGIFDGDGKEMKNFGVSGTNHVGSLFGYTDGATLRNMTFAAPYVTGRGVLVAEANNTVIIGCQTNQGVVTADGENTGALVGKATGTTTITNCYATETIVTGSGNNYIGGLVGSTEGSITHCYATGAVTGGTFVGGLVGKTAGMVINCYAWGTVAGTDYIGGLLGTTQSSIRNSYAAGTVTGTGDDKGGLLGSIGFGGDVDYCFWNKAAFGGSSEDLKGGGVVNLYIKDRCHGFTVGTDDIVSKLNTNYIDVWKQGTTDKKPIFN